MDQELSAYVEAVRWIVLPGARRPGMLGKILSLIGQDASGADFELQRFGDAWELIGQSGETQELTAANVIARVGDGTYRFTHARVRRDLPGLLFQAAVKSAEDSVQHVRQAGVDSGREDEGDSESHVAFEFVMATSAQDAAVRSAIAGVVLAFAAAEAHVNEWADSLGGWEVVEGRDEDRFPIERKCLALASKVGVSLDIGRSPFQELATRAERRDGFVHARPEEALVALVGPESEPGRGPSLEARRACTVVRRVLVELALLLALRPPRYLIYCPPGDPGDDEMWRNAILFAGTREDPDFAKTVDLLLPESDAADAADD